MEERGAGGHDLYSDGSCLSGYCQGLRSAGTEHFNSTVCHCSNLARPSRAPMPSLYRWGAQICSEHTVHSITLSPIATIGRTEGHPFYTVTGQ